LTITACVPQITQTSIGTGAAASVSTGWDAYSCKSDKTMDVDFK